MLDWQKFKDVPGWLDSKPAEMMYKYASNSPVPRFLELGSYAGKSACVLAQALKDTGGGTLLCCDFFPINSTYKANKDTDPIHINPHNTFWESLKAFGLSQQVIAVKGNYASLLPNIDGEFGLIYIDGGHHLERVLADGLFAWKHLCQGGYMIFHDYGNEMYPDVKVAIDSILKVHNTKIVEQCGITVVIQKN